MRRRRALRLITVALLVGALAPPPFARVLSFRPDAAAQPGRPGPGSAVPVRYRIDPEQSQLTFKAYSRLQNADGRFHRFDGEVTVDPRNLTAARLRLTVDPASIDTKNRKRDDHLRSPDFFDVGRHPEVTFESTRVTPAGGRVTVHGPLTIRGVSREIEVAVEVEVGDENLVARGEFVINRLHYGINYQSVLNPVQDVVNVAFTFHARRVP